MTTQPAARLAEYRKKRHFERTSEPAGDERTAAAGHLYVMQKHAASHDHYDLRLEHEGVLKSWALPKGASLRPGEKRLAIEVEDHPLEYGGFEGVIPKGEYGGGTVMLWDTGRWRPIGKHDADQIDFVLEGDKLKGAWTLVRTRGKGTRAKPGKGWLLIKRTDASPRTLEPGPESVLSGRTMEEIAADRDSVWTSKAKELPPVPSPRRLRGARRAKLPRETPPQLATLVEAAPSGDGWIHEIKLDGYRILARVADGVVRLSSRNGHDWTGRFPGIASALGKLPIRSAAVDGEVVVIDRDGSTSFRRLQEALAEGKTGGYVYFAFDLIHLGDFDLSGVAQIERKEALAQLLRAGGFGDEGAVRYSDHVRGNGPAFHAEACELGLEGIVSKRADASYQKGRSKHWLKVKCTRHEELVVGGYTEPRGGRKGFGALLLGAFDQRGELVYAGRVGTGFSATQLAEIYRSLREIETDENPFGAAVPDARRVHWVKPRIVVEVELTERTRDGRLRHPRFRGVRDDREPSEIAQRVAPGPTKNGSSAHRSDAVQPARPAPGEAIVAGIRLTHPDRVMYPEQGVTKQDLALYYEEIERWVLPHLENRPLTLVRCPEGRHKECFYQKHLGKTQAKSVPRVPFRESSGTKEYAYVREISDLVALVQAGVLELHPFGSRIDDLEHPDMMVLDLDPSPDVPWAAVLGTTRALRTRVEELGLAAFLRTTGGKGLHIVVPLAPSADWDTVKAFSQAIAEQHVKTDPSLLTTNMSKAKRRGKILIDYLRNARGSTAIASYSVRARQGAPIAIPVRWDELGPALRPDRYTLHNIRRRLAALRDDPWRDFEGARQKLTSALCEAVGLDR